MIFAMTYELILLDFKKTWTLTGIFQKTPFASAADLH